MRLLQDSSVWDILFKEYCFCPKYIKDSYRWLTPPVPFETFILPENCWNEEQERLVNSFFEELNITELYALDWQHDSFSFDPGDYGKLVREYYDVDRNCNVYFPSFYPNGDYHFFVDSDWKYAMFGHPWIGEIVVCGQELIDCFEANRKELALGDQGG